MAKREKIRKSVRIRVLMRDGHACQYCGARASEGAVLHVDHVTPVCRGGTNDEGNLITSCRDCNLGKGGSDLFVPREEYEKDVARLNALLNESREQLQGLQFDVSRAIAFGIAETTGITEVDTQRVLDAALARGVSADWLIVPLFGRRNSEDSAREYIRMISGAGLCPECGELTETLGPWFCGSPQPPLSDDWWLCERCYYATRSRNEAGA